MRRLGVAPDRLDALDGGRKLGPRRVERAVVATLDLLERGAQRRAARLGLLALARDPLELDPVALDLAGMLSAQALELRLQPGARRVERVPAGGFQLGQAAIELGARLAGLGERGG